MHRDKNVILGEDGYTNRLNNAPVSRSSTRAIERFQDNRNRAARVEIPKPAACGALAPIDYFTARRGFR